MNVTIKLFGDLRHHLQRGQEVIALELPPDTAIPDIMRQLGISDAEVGLAVVNGTVVPESSALSDGDSLELFSIIGGG